MKLDPSIIALKDFKLIKVFRLKLARYSTANKAPSINASEQNWVPSQHDAQRLKCFPIRSQHKYFHNIFLS
jgi:hypothetical protein